MVYYTFRNPYVQGHQLLGYIYSVYYLLICFFLRKEMEKVRKLERRSFRSVPLPLFILLFFVFTSLSYQLLEDFTFCDTNPPK